MSESKDQLIKKLRAQAYQIQQDIVQLAVDIGEGHCASALSIADILTALYFHRMNVDPKNPNAEDRDRFVLSKGHACQGLYVALHHAGFFDREKLYTFLGPNTGLPGHPLRGGAPGVELSTGSLGHGMSVSVGMALGAKLDKKKYNVFAIVGDGESNEGIVWEAALAAAHYKLDNRIVVLDRNRHQCDGPSANVMNLDPVEEKWESFGWEVRVCDGHNMAELVDVLDQAPFASGKPSLVLAETVKGHGVDFMTKNAIAWHYRAPSKDELKKALDSLAATYGCNE